MKYSIIVMVLCLILSVDAEAALEGSPSAERSFLEGDYVKAGAEADRLLAGEIRVGEREDLMYLGALSLMKQKRYKEARARFARIVSEFRHGKRSFDAELGIGDTYYLEGDHVSAEKAYEDIVKGHASNRNIGIVYYRIGESSLARGDREGAKAAFGKVRSLAPMSFEARMALSRNLSAPRNATMDAPQPGPRKEYYSVQVGAFKTKRNAENLVRELGSRSYDECSIEASKGPGGVLYKVRVGKSPTRAEAENYSKRLKNEGYSTKICP